MAWTRILGMCALWPWPWRYDLGSKSWHTLGSWTTIVWNIIQIQHGSEELWHEHTYFAMCAPWPWPSRYDLMLRSRNTLVSWTTIVRNIIQIQHCSEELWPGHVIWVCVHCDLDLGGMTLGQSPDTLLGHGQQLCEIISRANIAVRSYGLDTDFGYVCTVTLTLEVWPWFKVMTHPWVMDNNCVKYYPDRTRGKEVMARTRCEQTDRRTDRQTGGRTDRVIPIYPQTWLGGIKTGWFLYNAPPSNFFFWGGV